MPRKETKKTEAGKAVTAAKIEKAKKENEFIVNTEVNVRAEPRIGAEIIRILPAGTAVEVTQSLDEWKQIENGEKPAYVMARYVSDEVEADATDAEPAADEAEPAAKDAEAAADPEADEAEADADE